MNDVATTDPCARLNANRALVRIHHRSMTSRSAGSGRTGEQRFSERWMAALAALAQGKPPSECAMAWWKATPAGEAVTILYSYAMEIVTPYVKKYPYRVMAGALIAGAAIAWVRPWRWATTRSSAGVLTGLMDALLRQQKPPRP